MKSDITIEYQNATTIIDAKYYSKLLQVNSLYQSQSLHSNNLYQIYTYVKNKDIKNDGSVRGILLYAKPEGEKPVNVDYKMGGNLISVKTLDLEQDFKDIKAVLDGIGEEVINFPLELASKKEVSYG